MRPAVCDGGSEHGGDHATGVADPLRADFKGRAGGRIDFMQYGADFRISAPDNPVDIGKLIDGG